MNQQTDPRTPPALSNATPPLVEELAKAMWVFEGDNTPTWEHCIATDAGVVYQYRTLAEFVLQRLGKLTAAAPPVAEGPAATPRPTLDELLDKARQHVMTPEEKEAQRQSWMRGEMALSEHERGMTSRLPMPAAAEAANQELRQKFSAAEFWKQWVYPEGATAEQVQAELADYHDLMDRAAKVYEHITQGQVSKTKRAAQPGESAKEGQP
jgi:hypothetical protein